MNRKILFTIDKPAENLAQVTEGYFLKKIQSTSPFICRGAFTKNTLSQFHSFGHQGKNHCYFKNIRCLVKGLWLNCGDFKYC